MLTSICFIVIELAMFLSLMYFRLSEKEESIVCRIPVVLMVIMSFHAVTAGIMGILSIGITLFSIGGVDALAVITVFLLNRKHGRQKYKSDKPDLVLLGLLTAATLAFGLLFFGENLEIHFWSVDGAAHCAMAQTVANEHVLGTNLYFSALNNGIAMMLAEPFVTGRFFYKVFLVMELFDLWLSGMLFYSLTNEIIQNHRVKYAVIVLTAMYVIGYPLYAVIFGFSYFGAAVSIVVTVLIILKKREKGLIDQNVYYGIMNILFFSLFVCYTYLIPPVFVAVLLYVFLTIWKKSGKFISKNVITEELILFSFPCILGLVYSFGNVKELGSGGGVNNPGGCYFDLYSNFIPLLFFIIIGFIQSKKEKSLLSEGLLGICSFLFLAMFLAMNLTGHASIYYVSKIYNILWLVAFVYTIKGVEWLYINYAVIYRSCKAALVFIVCMSAVNMTNLRLNSSEYSKKLAVSYLPDIYLFNYAGLSNPYMTDDTISVFQSIKDEYCGEIENTIVSIGSEMDCAWFKTVTGQKNTVSYDLSELEDKISDDTSYIYCINSEIFNTNKEYLESFGTIEKEYSNGVLISLGDRQ